MAPPAATAAGGVDACERKPIRSWSLVLSNQIYLSPKASKARLREAENTRQRLRRQHPNGRPVKSAVWRPTLHPTHAVLRRLAAQPGLFTEPVSNLATSSSREKDG